MKNIKFLKEPGYIYDLFFIFVLNFNKELCLTNFINYDKSNEDTEHFLKILQDFEPISKDLFPFFFLKDNGRCFITTFYYEPYDNEFTTTYNLETVQSALTNHEQVISNLIQFYFRDISGQALEECKNSVAAIGKIIKESDYNDTVKSSLFSFFLDPSPVIQKLSYELMSKGFQLAGLFEKNFRKITELQQSMNSDDLTSKLIQFKKNSIDINNFDDLYVSICILSINCIRSIYIDDKVLLLLGMNYKDCIEYLINLNRLPELDAFGNAISESNRIEILDLILRKDEITIKDIEQNLKFTGTNAYYHLSLMLKTNMIKSRNQGRTVLYSINKQYFDVVCDILSKYSTKGG